MPLTTINFTLPIITRQQMRRDVITLFMNEQSGTGTGANASRYVYIVENYNAYQIELHRPAKLNKGFDFTVNIVGMYFKKNRRYSNPNYSDIFAALSYCQQNYPNYRNVIVPIRNDIYNCQNVTIANTGMFFRDFNNQQHPIEIILLSLKWLFIEQDFTYWNNSGRSMLYNNLQIRNLV